MDIKINEGGYMMVFPEEVFPEKLRRGLRLSLMTRGSGGVMNLNQAELNMLYTNILTCIGHAISNSFNIQVKANWIESSNLFSMNISHSGSGKSHLLDKAVGPLLKKNNELNNAFLVKERGLKKLRKEYKEVIRLMNNGTLDSNDPEVQRLRLFMSENNLTDYLYEHNGSVRVDTAKVAEEPTKLTIVSKNGTMQGNEKMFEENEGRSLLIFGDEFAGIYKNLNRFSKGGDIEAMLDLFEYGPVLTNNVSRDSSRYADSKVVSIAAASQLSALMDVFTSNNVDNGLLYRFLITVSLTERRSLCFQDDGIQCYEDYLSEYKEMMERLLRTYETIDKNKKTLVKKTQEAHEFLGTWQMNLEENHGSKYGINYEHWREIAGKYDRYINRFALIINKLRLWYENTDAFYSDNDVELQDYEKAAKLCDYFISNLVYVKERLDRPGFKNIKESDLDLLDKIEDGNRRVDIEKQIGKTAKIGASGAKHRLNKYISSGIIYKKNGRYYKKI
jgi:hypothetical protein